ncbi:unnamed protein product, partial [Rangifer tarandus platyrhynchus]
HQSSRSEHTGRSSSSRSSSNGERKFNGRHRRRIIRARHRSDNDASTSGRGPPARKSEALEPPRQTLV